MQRASDIALHATELDSILDSPPSTARRDTKQLTESRLWALPGVLSNLSILGTHLVELEEHRIYPNCFKIEANDYSL